MTAKPSTLCAVLTLPYPTSANALYEPTAFLRCSVPELVRRLKRGDRWQKSIAASVHRSAEADKYRKAVAAACLAARVSGRLAENPIAGALDVRVVAHPAPLNIRRDADNLMKALLDAIVFSGVVLDDSQFIDDRVRWGTPMRDPRVVVAIGRPERTDDHDWLGLDREAESWRAPRRTTSLPEQIELGA